MSSSSVKTPLSSQVGNSTLSDAFNSVISRVLSIVFSLRELCCSVILHKTSLTRILDSDNQINKSTLIDTRITSFLVVCSCQDSDVVRGSTSGYGLGIDVYQMLNSQVLIEYKLMKDPVTLVDYFRQFQLCQDGDTSVKLDDSHESLCVWHILETWHESHARVTVRDCQVSKICQTHRPGRRVTRWWYKQFSNEVRGVYKTLMQQIIIIKNSHHLLVVERVSYFPILHGDIKRKTGGLFENERERE